VLVVRRSERSIEAGGLSCDGCLLGEAGCLFSQRQAHNGQQNTGV
jgi:hypothetical protein